MRAKALAVLAAVALSGAVAATTPARAEEAREFSWGRVVVDKTYAATHPEQVGLQGVVADVRESVSDHEARISHLEGRVGALEQNITPTTPPPSGGATKGAQAPEGGDVMMSPGVIIAITGGQ